MSEFDNLEQRVDDLEAGGEADDPPMIVYRDLRDGQFYRDVEEPLTDEAASHALVVIEYHPEEWAAFERGEADRPGGRR